MTISMVRHFFILIILIYASVKDLKSLEIPNLCPVCIALSALLSGNIHPLGAFAPFALNLLCAFFAAALKKDMPLGFGDIKLFSALGLYSGLSGLCILASLAFIFGGLFALFLVLRSLHRKEATEKFIPFAPCIALSYSVLLVFEII